MRSIQVIRFIRSLRSFSLCRLLRGWSSWHLVVAGFNLVLVVVNAARVRAEIEEEEALRQKKHSSAFVKALFVSCPRLNLFTHKIN